LDFGQVFGVSAHCAASKKPAPAPPRPTDNAKKPVANGKALMEILIAIQSSSTKEKILGKVLALLPTLLSGC
jgi:hypothetical protein